MSYLKSNLNFYEYKNYDDYFLEFLIEKFSFFIDRKENKKKFIEQIKELKKKIQIFTEKFYEIFDRDNKYYYKDPFKLKNMRSKKKYVNIHSKEYKNALLEKFFKITDECCEKYIENFHINFEITFFKIITKRDDENNINEIILKRSHKIKENNIRSETSFFPKINSMINLVDKKENFNYFIFKPDKNIENKSILFKTENLKNYSTLKRECSYSNDSKLYINKKLKYWIIYNNIEQKFNLGKLKNSKIIGGQPKDIYDREDEKSRVKKILSLTILSINEIILFINQDHKLFSYDFRSNQLKVIVKKINKNGFIEKKELIPKNKFGKFLKIKSNIAGNIFFLQSENSIDLYDLNYYCLKSFEIGEDFLNFECFNDNGTDILLIQYKNDLCCFKITGLEDQINIEFQNYYDKTKFETFNSILDYFGIARNKYGLNPIFIGSPSSNKLIFCQTDRKKYKILRNYFKKLYLEKIKFLHKFDNKKVKKVKTDQILDIILTRIPIHAASIENSQLIPLKNGKNNYNEIKHELEKLLSKDTCEIIDVIIKKTNFSYYEEILKSWNSNNIYVISIIGKQSSGKSYFLNRLFGCRFNVAANRCTDGIWLSLTKKKDNNGNESLFVILDCEGLFSVKRSPDDEIKMMLAVTAISDMVFLNNDLSFNRNLSKLLEEIMNGLQGKLNSDNGKLFQSDLCMILRDVSNKEHEGAIKEFRNFINNVMINKRNFLNTVFKNTSVHCLEYYEKPVFNKNIKEARRIFIDTLRNTNRWIDGADFLESFKILFAQILIQDDRDMMIHKIKIFTKNMFRKHIEYFFSNKKFYEKSNSVCIFKYNDIDIEFKQSELDFSFINENLKNNIEKGESCSLLINNSENGISNNNEKEEYIKKNLSTKSSLDDNNNIQNLDDLFEQKYDKKEKKNEEDKNEINSEINEEEKELKVENELKEKEEKKKNLKMKMKKKKKVK